MVYFEAVNDRPEKEMEEGEKAVAQATAVGALWGAGLFASLFLPPPVSNELFQAGQELIPVLTHQWGLL